MLRYMYASFLFLSLFGVTRAEPGTLKISAPQPQQITQRVGFDPTVKPPVLGYADVVIQAEYPTGTAEGTWEYRYLLPGAKGKAVDWINLHRPEIGTKLNARARIAAGGWYRLEVRCRDKDQVLAQGTVEPIGVGEVFIVAGQSYATNCNDERLKVTDLQQRVTAFDTATGIWAVAHDPQPAPDKSDGGSIWPPLGDALVKVFRVPVGFVNVAVGATSSMQWLPKGQLHPRLVEAGKTLGRFRAVLWQQGESDVIAKTSTAAYVSNLKTIRHTTADAWDFEAPWLLAKSTHHPTVYTDPEGEGRIRAGYDELVKFPGFAAGPDTDTLKGENRGDAKSRRHFSAIGQRRAAEIWFDVLKQQLNSRRPIHESLAELHLLEPAWASKVVQRESSILLQKDGGQLEVRLAFPVDAILDVVTADGQHRFDVRDFTLSLLSTHTRLTKSAPLEAIKDTDLFPPKDSPNSYKHRIGHPEQNLLYRPGRWFHDRNVEITYRRRDNPEPIPTLTGSLPKTMARLRDGKPLTLGISGDSISTGLDASLTAKAFPYQPGYPDLVAAQLEAKYRTSIVLKNRAVSGWSVANGVTDLDKLLAEKPNLIVVAYGMNDVGRRDPAWFHKQTKAILERIRAADENIEVILVAPMLGNKEWIHTPREMFAKYRDELKSLTREGVILADVTDVWERMLKNKHDLDLTGNGLNHPNDFGHRLYAQAILSAMKK